MNDLTLIHAPGVPGNLSVAEITSAIYYGQNATAESTRSAYNSDMARFDTGVPRVTPASCQPRQPSWRRI